MRTTRIAGALWLSATLLAGCSSSNSSSNDESMNALASQMASTICSAMVQCSCTDAAAQADCQAAYTEMVKYELSMMLVEHPAQMIDDAKAKTCLADVKANLSGCSAPSPGQDDGIFPQSCNEMLVGTQPQGDMCWEDQDCAPGLGCDWRDQTCAPLVAVEGDCNYVSCQEGLQCQSGTCASLPAAGAPCPYNECQDGLRCVYVSADDRNECVAPHTANADCSDGAGCVDGTYCDSGTETCLALVPDGGDCTSWDQCLHGWCNYYEEKCADPGICGMMGPK